MKLYRNTVLVGLLVGKPGSGAVFEADSVAPCTPVVRALVVHCARTSRVYCGNVLVLLLFTGACPWVRNITCHSTPL